MSRVGKTPVKLPEGVKSNLKGNTVVITGKKGELDYTLQPGIKVEEKDGELIVSREDDSRPQKALHGLTRALINNMVIGVTEGFEKELQIIGTGYSAERIGPWLKLSVGFAHDILMEVPENLDVEAKLIPRREQGALGVQAAIKVSGIDKEDVGKFAAEIKRCRPPLNYATGKGIRYKGEYVRIKPGKAGATA
ncbi:MAG: 50S ribosomal protein L6 [Candidatus Cloacimonetes bacterium]|nr:50S ribosomal protein L6 [Candidatus Cloacimonadota bacterium]MCF7814345.1 50S ribosomal protein L6 [Candidatus Cloacimonadota bacterium]MCF7868963.1 50S ribosomal protein L6 [Candidatus Cloacimonadota bacterium]MCF7884357.1 50S ribosomal protein L6 [Candidatus Cloacimonadota bacterium]